jgi:hypothetical protein
MVLEFVVAFVLAHQGRLLILFAVSLAVDLMEF